MEWIMIGAFSLVAALCGVMSFKIMLLDEEIKKIKKYIKT